MATQPFVLIVEDDPKVASLLKDYLHASGIAVSIEKNGVAAIELVRDVVPDVVLLDAFLPGLDGIEVCKAIRKFSSVPILMVTARVDEFDRLQGLASGADDYICKPFSPREVVARVNVHLRRQLLASNEKRRCWSIDAAGLKISWRAYALNLTPIEFRIFRTLAHRAGRVFSRAQLLDVLHEDGRDVSDRAIDSHVKNIRRKIQAIAPQDDCIVSVYGLGYRFDDPEG